MDPVQPEASVVQTGLGIRYIGDYVYAYSGAYGAETAASTKLEFTTGSGVIAGVFQLNTPVSTGTGIQASTAQVLFNDEVVARIKTLGSTSNQGFSSSQTQDLIIPPFTKVEVIVTSTDDQAGQLGSVVITGRVYGAE
jgi:hypothetical protein